MFMRQFHERSELFLKARMKASSSVCGSFSFVPCACQQQLKIVKWLPGTGVPAAQHKCGLPSFPARGKVALKCHPGAENEAPGAFKTEVTRPGVQTPAEPQLSGRLASVSPAQLAPHMLTPTPMETHPK